MVLIILVLINLIAKYFCDRIRFKGNFKSDWMIGAGKYVWHKRTVWTKGVFSFLSDGWHFFDAVRNMSFIIVVIMLLGVQWYYCILGYALFGGGFNLLYKLKG